MNMLTPHFSLAEFVATQHREIDNTLPQGLWTNAVLTCSLLERVRSYLGQLKGKDVPIYISSGYRCPELNEAVGSKPASDHVNALAVDWTAQTFGTPYEICKALEPQFTNLDLGQLIHEFDGWVHIGVKPRKKSIDRILTIDKRGTRVGIFP